MTLLLWVLLTRPESLDLGGRLGAPSDNARADDGSVDVGYCVYDTRTADRRAPSPSGGGASRDPVAPAPMRQDSSPRARVVVTGAAGQLGSAMVGALGDLDVVPLTRRELELTDPATVRDCIATLAPTAIINCAAFNDVDAAEDDVQGAFAANAFAVRSLARAAERAGAAFVHFSTDFVFSGSGGARPYREDDPPCPQSVYAASKLVGEWFALDAPRVYVLRIESLFGCQRSWTGRRGTLESIVARIEAGQEVRALTDRVVTPSRLSDIAAATRHLLETGVEPGLYHCVNSGPATWYEVAEAAAARLGVTARLTPVTTGELRLKATRPMYCALDNGKLARAGFKMPRWSDALHDWLATRGVASV